MPKIRISRSNVDKLESIPGKQIKYFDTKIVGFGVIVNGASKSYFVQCRVKDRVVNGKPVQIWETIGRVGVISYDVAVKRAGEILDGASQGVAPDDIRAHRIDLEAQKISDQINEKKKDITLMQAFEEYVLVRKKLKDSTVNLYRLDIDRYIGDWKDIPIRQIDGTMIIKKHSEAGASSRSRADGVMRVLRALFNHMMVMHEDIIHKNPVIKLTAVDGWYRVGRRETYIKPDSLKPWLSAVLGLESDTTTDFLLVLLFQGSRLEETASLKWKDIDLVNGLITFRETKNGKILEVPVSKYIHNRLKNRAKSYFFGAESWVFPSYGATGHIKNVRSSLIAITDATGVASTHHDLRRSFLSYCDELGIDIFTRKRLVNHAIPMDVTEGYTMFNMERLRSSVEKVAEFILTHVGIEYSAPMTISLDGLTDEQKMLIADIVNYPAASDGASWIIERSDSTDSPQA